ncbi:transcription intermediary factor 1-beta-like [Mytilus edulis]|uniref:transcription intermediary factor 1-beta-like n=1 Tax=Mytilus edulis TaxID=6550 RepID=UPI0039EED832
MASSEPSCDVCEFQHVLKSASIWCSDCDEGLCIDCSKHHGISKATRKHVTIPISEYKLLPTYITNIKQTCSTHDEKYLIYCNEPECACCSKCIVEKHTKCQNISNLDDVVKNTKTSNAFLEIHESVNEVAENIKRIRQDKNNNLKTLSEQRKQIERDFQQVRLNINRHLDKLQEDFILELHEIEKRENKKINQLMKALDKHESKVAEHQKNIANIKQHASDLQTFLALKQLEGDVDDKCQFIDSITESGVLNRVEIKFNINTSLTDIANSVLEFGKVFIDISNSSVNIVKKKQQQAQLIVPKVSSIMPIENIQVKLEQTINTKSSDVRGCCMLPDSRFVFAYPELNKVTVFKEDGRLTLF